MSSSCRRSEVTCTVSSNDTAVNIDCDHHMDEYDKCKRHSPMA